MEFSSVDPKTSNLLNIAAKENNFQTVHNLLKNVNPNCLDNRGWTCLHEAAANDCYQSLMLILKHPDCKPLVETREGHTALYLACHHHSSLETIKALLNSVEDIANYGSTESVTPLHVASSQGIMEIIQLLIDYGAMLHVQNSNGDTPLHDAASASQLQSVTALLHAGADPAIKNEKGYTPFHMACLKGSLSIVEAMLPFIDDINEPTADGDTPLIIASGGNHVNIVKFLLDNEANPHITKANGFSALDEALNHGWEEIFEILLGVMNKEEISRDIVLIACKPDYYNYNILGNLLHRDLGPEYFDFYEKYLVALEPPCCIRCLRDGGFEPYYEFIAPLNAYLNVCSYSYNIEHFYLFLMNGVSVNALRKDECPPLVYIHYVGLNYILEEVFQILMEHNCNVDYFSTLTDHSLPDAFIASVVSYPHTILWMLPYSLYCEPEHLLSYTNSSERLRRIPTFVQQHLISLIDSTLDIMPDESLPFYVPPLKHLSRLKVRSAMRSSGIKTTEKFLHALDKLPIPPLLKLYLRYL